jgi:hypothetical protein
VKRRGYHQREHIRERNNMPFKAGQGQEMREFGKELRKNNRTKYRRWYARVVAPKTESFKRAQEKYRETDGYKEGQKEYYRKIRERTVQGYIRYHVPEIISYRYINSFSSSTLFTDGKVLIDSGFLYKTKDGNKALVRLYEMGDNIDLYTIYVEHKGRGLGRKIMDAMKEYADKTMKTITPHQVRNDRFFISMGFKETSVVGGYRYNPKWRLR